MEATVEPTTPVTTPETSTAAPAITEPSESSATSQRPRSFQEAFEQVAARETADPDAPTETAATEPASASTPASAHPTADKKGPIPFEVHEKALANARTKAADEALTQYREQYGWAEQVPRETVQEWTSIANRMSTDPIAFLSELQAEIAAHPVFGPQLRSHAARTLAGGRSVATEADPEPEADVQIVDAEGRVTGTTYSAARLAERDAWNRRQMLAEMQKELAPIKAEREAAQHAREQAAFSQKVNAATDDVLAEVDDILDGAITAKNDALIGEVARVMTAHPDWSAHKAALHVRKTHIVPTLDAKATASAVDRLKQKAAGNTATGTGAAATPTRPRNPQELAKFMESLG